jgi:hypothetical protein
MNKLEKISWPGADLDPRQPKRAKTGDGAGAGGDYSKPETSDDLGRLSEI